MGVRAARNHNFLELKSKMYKRNPKTKFGKRVTLGRQMYLKGAVNKTAKRYLGKWVRNFRANIQFLYCVARIQNYSKLLLEDALLTKLHTPTETFFDFLSSPTSTQSSVLNPHYSTPSSNLPMHNPVLQRSTNGTKRKTYQDMLLQSQKNSPCSITSQTQTPPMENPSPVISIDSSVHRPNYCWCNYMECNCLPLKF